jgi:hypothetical protein
MKLFVLLFLSFSLFGVSTFAKNKVLFTVCVNCTPENKEEPLYDLYVMPDFKKPGAHKTLESRGRFSFGSSNDYIVYIKQDGKDNSLYIITDFTAYTKVKVSDNVSEFQIKDGILYFEKIEKAGDKIISVLFAITDFKTLNKQEVNRGYSRFIPDSY